MWEIVCCLSSSAWLIPVNKNVFRFHLCCIDRNSSLFPMKQVPNEYFHPSCLLYHKYPDRESTDISWNWSFQNFWHHGTHHRMSWTHLGYPKLHSEILFLYVHTEQLWNRTKSCFGGTSLIMCDSVNVQIQKIIDTHVLYSWELNEWEIDCSFPIWLQKQQPCSHMCNVKWWHGCWLAHGDCKTIIGRKQNTRGGKCLFGN